MTLSNERIGLVGVGRMGANMARRLQDVGCSISAINDVDGETARSLANELNCFVAPGPAQVAERSTVILTVVTDDAAMEKIYSETDPGSLLAHAKGRLFINCATLSPHIHVGIERRVEERGGQVLEACLAGSIPQARSGTLFLMCSGRQEVYERARPLLEKMSAQMKYIGPAGQASKVKALVNMVMNINTAALAEGLGLGAALGLDLAMLREVFSQTGAASRVLETDGEDMQNRDHECYFSASHAAKDSGIACALGKSAGLDLPLAEATWEQYKRLVRAGKGELDKSAVAELTFKDRVSSA